MFIGVVFFSMTISNLTSLLANLDEAQIALDEKLRILGSMNKKYKIPEDSIIYDNKKIR